MFSPSRVYPDGIHADDRDENSKGTVTTDVFTRAGTRPPPFYYLTGFHLSRHYENRDEMDEPLHGRDESAPEHRSQTPCNPFRTDIYCIGNLVRREFIEVRLAYYPRVRS